MSGLSCRVSLYRDEARRGVSVAAAAEHALHSLRADSSQKASHTHDNRHWPSLCEALDVSRTEL